MPSGGCRFAAATLVLAATGLLVPIEEIEVGDLLACQIELHDRALEPGVESELPDHQFVISGEGWKIGRFAYEIAGERAEATLLRPAAWFERYGVETGRVVPFRIPGIWTEALVLEVRDCPPLETQDQGPGSRVVTGTFRRVTGRLFELDLDGGSRPIRATGEHPFRSITRGSWVPLEDLEPGERIESDDGQELRVLGVRETEVEVEVFNLEVHRSHTYFVEAVGAGVHNGSCPRGGGRGGKQFRGPDPEATGPHTRFRRDPQTGEITHYETYDYPAPGQGKRVDLTGPPHNGVDTPHVVETKRHVNPDDPSKSSYTEGETRPARPDEIPGGGG